MKTHNNLYKNLCSIENLKLAFRKAKKRKSLKYYVIEFEKNLDQELLKLKSELEFLAYEPKSLKRFIIRDPKTRTIHASAFRDRIVHHALINIIGPIFEKSFIHDSYASRPGKGTHKTVQRFDQFKRKVSGNGKLVGNPLNINSVVGYVLKADVRRYFDTVDHEILIEIVSRKIKDEKVIWLIRQILNNFDAKIEGKGMPLGNFTSQFFANVYLNDLDRFVKQQLRIKYYIRYVDDFVILNRQKEILEYYKNEIGTFLLENLKLELHPDKSKILPLRDGITFLGYRIFYHHKLLRKSNLRKFYKTLKGKLLLVESKSLSRVELLESLQGWFGYAMHANTYGLRCKALEAFKLPS